MLEPNLRSVFSGALTIYENKKEHKNVPFSVGGSVVIMGVG